LLTEKIKISTTSEVNKNKILCYQKLYSTAFRVVYNNRDLTQDPDFIKSIIERYLFSAKNFEYVCSSVDTKYKQEDKIRENKENKIEKIHEELQKESKKKKPSRSKITKLQKKISALLSSIKKSTTFGGKALLRDITRQSQVLRLMNIEENKEEYNKKANILQNNKRQFSENRIMMMCFKGDAAHKGSRMFDFKDLSKGIILFWYNNEEIEIKFKIKNEKQRHLFEKLELLAEGKEMPLAVSLSNEELHISYEEGKVNGKYFDEKAFYRSIKDVKDKAERKRLITKAHREHEERCFTNKKPNRYAAIDQNPDGIGYCILDRMSESVEGDFVIVKKDFISFEELGEKEVSSDKRKHEMSIAIKNMFIDLEHHKVCKFIKEELAFNDSTDHGNKKANRKINNVWLRTRIHELTTKWCAFYGMKVIDINPYLSSFIGNINYEEYDPIAASIEIGRRGMIKFIKGNKWLPTYHKGFITKEMLHGDDSKMDYNELLNADSWKEAWLIISTSGMSVRRVDKEKYPFEQYIQNRTEKSKVSTLVFL
jgi:hypothetical protein